MYCLSDISREGGLLMTHQKTTYEFLIETDDKIMVIKNIENVLCKAIAQAIFEREVLKKDGKANTEDPKTI